MELSAVSSEKIASLLATNGILSQDRLTKISVQCAQNKEKIVPELLKKNYVKEEDIVKVISRNFAIKTNDIKAENIRPDVLKVLPVEFIKKEKIVALEYDLEDNTINHFKRFTKERGAVISLDEQNKLEDMISRTLKDAMGRREQDEIEQEMEYYESIQDPNANTTIH